MDAVNMEANDTTSFHLQLQDIALGNAMSEPEQLSSGGAFGNPAFYFSGLNTSDSLVAGPASLEILATDPLGNEESEPIDRDTSSLVAVVNNEEAAEEDANIDDFGEAEGTASRDGAEEEGSAPADEEASDEETEIPVVETEPGPSAGDSRASTLAEIYRLAKLLNVVIIEPPNDLGNSALFLEKLPLEIRQMVYELLLVNPILGITTSISKHQDYGANTKYDLYPAILGVNRQIREEASHILYTTNTFYMLCLPVPGPSSNVRGQVNLSPLTRYFDSSSEPFPVLRHLSSFSKVAKWKVVMSASAWDDYEPQPSWSFFEICRAISRGSPTSLEIAIIPKGIEDGVFEYQDMTAALAPLQLLRGIGTYDEVTKRKFEIRDATHFEIPDAVDQDEDALEFVSQMDEHAALEVELTLLVQSQEPVEKSFEMYASLLSYAQTFEMLKPFKLDMAISEDQSFDITERELSTNDRYLHRKLGNPFKNGVYPHPVEVALMRAERFSEIEDVASFKTERAFVLEYLEPQYQRMSSAASHLLEFIKDEKRSGGIFDCYGYGMDETEECRIKCSLAMLLLKEYDSAFHRDIPFHISAVMRQNRGYYKRIYSELGVGTTLMEQLNTAIEIQNLDGFVEDYKFAVNKLDALLLAARHARKQLFKWDPEVLDDRRCSIEPELARSEDMIQWDVNEPSLGPDEFDEHYEPSSDEDSDDSSAPSSEDGEESDHRNGSGEDGNDSDLGEEEDGASDRSESIDDDASSSDVQVDDEEDVDDVVPVGTDHDATLAAGPDNQVDLGGW